MAKGSIMLQVEVVQDFAGGVTDAPPILAQVFEFLSFGKTTVREITAEKSGGILITGSDAVSFGVSSKPFARLRLFLKEQEEVFFLAPSHVSSPQFEAGFAILEITDGGLSASGGPRLFVGRRIGGHAYLDEVP